MDLTLQQRAWVDGAGGEARALAMQLLIAAGEVWDAPRLRPIEAAYVNTAFSGSPSHLDLLETVAAGGGRVAVPTSTNVAGTALGDGRNGPQAAALARDTARLSALHEQIGARPTFTCAPYQLPKPPRAGAHVACSESNAVSYFNSVLGVRTAKYGDYLDLAAALTGFVPEAGLHTDAGRAPALKLDVDIPPEAFMRSDLASTLLGLHMGKRAGTRVVLIEGLPPTLSQDALRAIGTGGATWGGVALYHAAGLTPEAEMARTQASGIERQRVTVAELEAAREDISGFDNGPVDAVVIGTPHASVHEARALAGLLAARRVAKGTAMFIQLNRFTAQLLEADGSAETLRAAGVRIVRDTCLYWRPTAQSLSGRVMTTSGKLAHYAAAELGIAPRLASLASCVESAVAGHVVETGAVS